MEIASKAAVQRYLDTEMHSVIVFRDGVVPNTLDDLPFDYMDAKAILRDPNSVCTNGRTTGIVYPSFHGVMKHSHQVLAGELAGDAFVGKYTNPFTVENSYLKGGVWYSRYRLGMYQGLSRYLPLSPPIDNIASLPGQGANGTHWTECILTTPATITAFSVTSRLNAGVNYMDVELLNMDDEWIRPIGDNNDSNGNMRMYASLSNFGDVWRTVESYYSNAGGMAIYNNNIVTPTMIKGMRFRGHQSTGYINSVVMYSDDAPANVDTPATITHALILPYGPAEPKYQDIQSPILVTVGADAGNDLIINNQGFNPVATYPDIDYSKMGLSVGHI